MKVRFLPRDNGPERLISDAEIVFGAGPLEGMKLTGLSLWKTADGDVSVTFPSRSFGVGNDRRFFDYLRADERDSAPATVRRVKDWVVDEYRAELARQEA